MVRVLPKISIGILGLMIFMVLGLYTTTYSQPVSGTRTIPGDYSTLEEAILDLNAQGVGDGGAIFDIEANYTETAPLGGYLITASGTVDNPIVFQKSGMGANPLILAYAGGIGTPGSATPDGVFKIAGGDYITFDGIDVSDPNAANPATMEFGYGFFKSGVADGAQYNLVKNCVITLNRINNASGTSPMVEGSVGILVINSTPSAATTVLTPSAGGTNSNNRFYSNTIQNCNYGIALSGYAAATPFTLGDTGNDIGGSSSGTGNQILNYGGAPTATNPAAGIRANNQWGINISYNNINNNNGSGVNHANTLRGIYAQSGTSASVTINNNTVTLKGGGTTSQLSGIENAIGSTAASNTVNMNNNVVQNCTYTTATTGAFYGIYNTSSAATVNMNGNTVTNNILSGTGSFYGIHGTSPANLNINNNTVTNNAGTSTGTYYLLYVTSPATASIGSNNVSNNVRPVISGTTHGVSMTSPANITINNNTFDGNTFTGAASTGSVYGIYGTSSAVTETYTNNIFRNFSTTGTGTIGGIYQNSATGVKTYQNNQIYNFSGGTLYGIRSGYGSTDDFSSNTIYSLTSTHATSGSTYGIYISGGTTNNIYKNKIFDLAATLSTTPTLYGIYISGGTTNTIYNNLVGKLTAPLANASNPVVGIYLNGGTTDNVYYNTVYLNAASSGALFGTTALYASTTPTVNLRNNIFVNTSTPNGATGFTSAYKRSSITLTSYAAASNNNCFYAGTPGTNNLIFYDGTNSDQTIGAFKGRVGPRDANSFLENPNFISTNGSDATFLHINDAIQTQLEGGGGAITGITNDFDGDIRNATTPDVGADEGTFPPMPMMLYSSSTTTQVAGSAYKGIINQAIIRLEITTSGTSSPLQMTDITVNANGTSDIVDINGTNAKIYYTGTSPAFSTSTLFGSAAPSVSNFTISGTQALQSGVNYFWLTYDVSATALSGNTLDGECTGFILATVPQIPSITVPAGNKIIASELAGDYNVGTGQTYTTLTTAIIDLNSRGVSAPVRFLLTDGTYSTSETFPLTITPFAGSSVTNLVTIKPAEGVNATITGNSTTVIKISGADNIIIDGSANGTNSRDLTITNSISGSAIQLASLGTGLGANNITIKNCKLSTGLSTSGFGISIGGATNGSTGDDNDNVTIQNNVITKCYEGIYAIATSTGTNNNLIIRGNIIGSNIASEYVYKYGIDVAQGNGGIITQNTIQNLISSTTTPMGISIGTGFINAEISRNNINNIIYNSTTGYGGRGIFVNTGNAVSNLNIFNNIIYKIGGDGYSSFSGSSPVGMYFDGTTGGLNIYFNSVYMSGTLTYNAVTLSTAILFNTATCTAIDLRNNIFQNSLNNTVNTGAKNYAIYSVAPTSSFTNINYNDYYVSGIQGKLGYLGSDRLDLVGWRTATAQDLNSISGNPLFNSTTQLRPTEVSPVLNIGTPIAGITTDFTNAVRNPGSPSLGAYEIGSDATPPAISFTNIANTTSTMNVILTDFATITDDQGVNVSAFTKPRIYFKKSTDANTYTFNTSGANGWKYVEASNASSPFSFTIDYGLLNGFVGEGTIIQYFIVAQDITILSNVGIKSGVFNEYPSSVHLTADAFPLGGTIYQYKIVGAPMAGDYTVGAALLNKLVGGTVEKRSGTINMLKKVPVYSDQMENTGNKTSAQAVDEGNSVVSKHSPSTTIKCTDNNRSISGYKLTKVEYPCDQIFVNGEKYDGPNYRDLTPEEKQTLGNGYDNVTGLYTTLAAAINDLNDRGVSAPVRFLLTDGTYTEGPLTITQVNGASLVNNITIKPNTGVTSVISNSVNSGPIINIGSSFVTLDGSNNGTTTKDLSIINTSITAPNVVTIISNETIPVEYSTIKNCNITNGALTSSAIVISSSAIGTAGYFNNITVQNNVIKKAYVGVYSIGVVGNGLNVNLLQNTLNASGSDAIRLVGLYMQGVTGGNISQNVIGNLEAATGETDHGIFLATGTSNVNVTRNEIYTLKYTGASGWGPKAITVSTGVTDANILIANNVIYDITGDGDDCSTPSTAIYEPMGLYLYTTQTGLKVYNNSINLFGNTLNYHVNSLSVGIFLGTGTTAELYNNSIVNNLGLLLAKGLGAAAIMIQTDSSQLINSDNNIYYVNPTGSAVKIIGRIGTTNHLTLDGFKLATTKDANSLNGNPAYTTNTNLIPDINNANSWIPNGGGKPLALVPVDFTGAVRSGTVATGSSDIGAYEITPAVSAPLASASGVPVASGTTTYSFAGRSLASINWGAGGTIPSGLDFFYYPGTNAPVTQFNTNSNCYWVVTVPDGSGFTYDITFYYDESALGDISLEDNIRLAKSENNGASWMYFATAGTNPGEYQLNTANNSITVYGLTSFSTFTLTDVSNPLPVELNSFTSIVKGRNIVLNWETKTEVNTAKFFVERSKTESNIWNTCGEVKAAGNSNTPQSYTFTDTKLNSGKYTYRLKITDTDGKSMLSKTIETEIELPKTYNLSQNYPNPFNPSTRIDYQLPVDARVTVELYNITGERVAVLVNNEQAAGYYTLDVTSSLLNKSLASGVYIYRMAAVDNATGNNFVNVKKMMMLK